MRARAARDQKRPERNVGRRRRRVDLAQHDTRSGVGMSDLTLRQEGTPGNHPRGERLSREERCQGRCRQRNKVPVGARQPVFRLSAANVISVGYGLGVRITIRQPDFRHIHNMLKRGMVVFAPAVSLGRCIRVPH